MTSSQRIIFAILFSLVLSGCAYSGARGPSETIGGEVSKFHADLSQFRDDMNDWQGYSSSRISNATLRTDATTATTDRLQVEWQLMHAKTENELFTSLHDQGVADIAAQNGSPSAVPQLANVDLSLDKLSSVAGVLDKITEPRSLDDELKFLVGYGSAINDQLKKLKDASKKEPQQP